MTRPTVLMWHAMGNRNDTNDPYRLFVTPKAFANQLDYLGRHGSRFLDLDEFIAGTKSRRWPARSVLVTIDDGYLSALEIAAPLLAERKIPAVLFAVPGRLGAVPDWMPPMSAEPLLSAGGLREIETYGVQVESHSWDHNLLPGLSDDALGRQVQDSRTALADILGRLPVAFAYPSGLHDERARNGVKAAGYTVGFSVHESSGDQWALPRVDVNPTDTDRTFRLKTSPAWRPALRTVGRLHPLRRGVHRLLGSARSPGQD